MLKKCLLITCIVLFQAGVAFAAAPVVDESENEQFAIIDDNSPQDRPFVQEEASVDTNTNELLNKINGLQQEIQELRGQLEFQAHSLKELQEQQLNFYKDIDARLQNQSLNINTAPKHIDSHIDSNKKPAQTPVAINTNKKHINYNSSNPVDEQISYLAAYDYVKTNQYDEAIIAMQKFINKYPDSGYTKNAQYWIAKLSKEQKSV